jgi:hypothetical protein
MKQSAGNSDNSVSKLIYHLTADKKKAVFACCLVVLMLFMWVKVLIKKGPASASASPVNTAVATSPKASTKTPAKVTYIELPTISGRHDAMERDFFDSKSWQEFLSRNGGTNEGREISKASSSLDIKTVAQKLKLEAIWMGNVTQAYINNTSLKVGDKLPVSEGSKKYEFEVISIGQNDVVVRCEDTEVLLKLSQVTGNKK